MRLLVLCVVFSGASRGRYEDDDDGQDDIKAMLKVLLRKLDRTADADGPQPRAYVNVTQIQQQHRNTDMHNVVSRRLDAYYIYNCMERGQI